MHRPTLTHYTISFLLMVVSITTSSGQNINSVEKKTLQEINSYSKDIHNWQYTGILEHIITARFRKLSDERMKKLFESRGVKVSKSASKLSYDFAYIFICANNETELLYAEKKIIGSVPDSVPAPSEQTFNMILKGGNCFIQRGSKTYEYSNDSGSQYNSNRPPKIERVKDKSTTIPGASHGFYLYPAMITPKEAISKYNFHYLREEVHPLFGQILVFEGTNPDDMTRITFHLSTKFGYMVIKTVVITSDNIKLTECNILSIIKVSNYWFPKESQVTTFIRFSEGTEPLIKTYKFSHHKVNFDPSENLDVKLSSGDYIIDAKSDQSFKLGAKGEKILLNTKAEDTSHTFAYGWLFMASVTTLLVLTVFAYVRWKRKQWAKRS